MRSSQGRFARAGAGAFTSLLCAVVAAAEPDALFSIDAHGSHLTGRFSLETGRFEACVLQPALDAAAGTSRLEMRADYSLSLAVRPATNTSPRPDTARLNVDTNALGDYPVVAGPSGEWRIEIPADAAVIGRLASGPQVEALVAGTRLEWPGTSDAFRELLACAELAGSFDPRNDVLTRSLYPDDRPGTPVRRRLVTLLRLAGFREVRMVPPAEMGREPGALVWKTRSGHGTAYTESLPEYSDVEVHDRNRAGIAFSCPEELEERRSTPVRLDGYHLLQSEVACRSTGVMTVATSIVDFIDVVTLAAVGEREIEPFSAANRRLLSILATLLAR